MLYRCNGSIERIGEKSMNNNTDVDNSTLVGRTRSNKPVTCQSRSTRIFISGTSGSGKTILISNFILHAVLRYIGLLILDGKGDTGKGSILEITREFCTKHNRPLYVVDMNNPSKSAKYNPFNGATETVAKDMLVNMSDWSEAHYKANTERYIQRVVKMMNIASIPLSFKSIIHYMETDNFESLSTDLQKSEQINKECHIENIDLIKTSGKIAEQAVARFATIAESEIGQIFEDDGIDIFTALNSGAVILFVLNPLIFPETSKAFGRLILIDAKKAVSKLFGTEKRSFFVFDEINVYASTVLIDLINKSRSAGVTCISAAQSLADLEVAESVAFKNQVIENNNNYFVMRQNSFSDAEEWAKTIGTKEAMQLTHQLSGSEATGMGTAKKVREFIVHPDEIKAFRQGECVFLSRDTGKCEKIKIIKPF